MSMSRAYYNENDPKAAAWLRELIKHGHIADGIVDERSIADVRPADLDGFVQCHWFAGIGVWSYALRQAGWADDRPVWTGSCPCQPFSIAGAGAGMADERHLWPAWYELIQARRPVVCFGEQVSSADALPWLDNVRTDMDAAGYTVGSVDTCAAGVGAPHIRQRLYFVAERLDDTASARRIEAGSREPGQIEDDRSQRGGLPVDRRGYGGLANTNGRNARAERQQRSGEQRLQQEGGRSERLANAGRISNEYQGLKLGVAQGENQSKGHQWQRFRHDAGDGSDTGEQPAAGPTNGYWAVADWLYCRDGKWRPAQRGTFPLVTGTPRGLVRGGDTSAPIDANKTGEARTMRLRGYGNAINAAQATAFIEAYVEVL